MTRTITAQLHRHHRQVASYGPLVADEQASWERRRRRYLEALATGEGILAVATAAEGPVGYAFAVLHQGLDDTFGYDGDRYAELFTLSVAPPARGRGIGGRLCDLVEAELAARGVAELEVAVMAGNDEALRFYRRRGFRPASSASGPLKRMVRTSLPWRSCQGWSPGISAPAVEHDADGVLNGWRRAR